jgi:hypothetical protein|uniref:ATP synthase CF0 subunit B n=1 Tax=Prototheca lentecrescens TaxID=2836214 RepID=UPI0030035351
MFSFFRIIIKLYLNIDEVKIYFYNLSLLLVIIYHYTDKFNLIKDFLLSRKKKISDKYDQIKTRRYRTQANRNHCFLFQKEDDILELKIMLLEVDRAIQQLTRYYYDLFFYKKKKMRNGQIEIINREENKNLNLLIEKAIKISFKEAKEKIKLKFNNNKNHRKYNELAIAALLLYKKEKE